MTKFNPNTLKINFVRADKEFHPSLEVMTYATNDKPSRRLRFATKELQKAIRKERMEPRLSMKDLGYAGVVEDYLITASNDVVITVLKTI